MAEGRSGFDPSYNSADHQPATEPVEAHEVTRLASQFGLPEQSSPGYPRARSGRMGPELQFGGPDLNPLG